MAMPVAAPAISVAGNVEGSIVVGDHNFVVNTNHGTIIYQEAAPQVRLRDMFPRPPRAPRPFLGREKELAALNTLIGEQAPVLLLGGPGVGKSYLLKKAANEDAARQQPHGVVLVEGIDKAGVLLSWEDLLQTVFEALFESQPPLKVNYTTARTYLSNTSPLLVFDNLNLSADDLDRLADVFPQAPILGVPFRAGATEAFDTFKLQPLPRSAAVELLAQRAGVERNPETESLLEKLSQMMQFLPLSLVTVGNAVREYAVPLQQAEQELEAIEPEAVQDDLAAIERSFRFADAHLSPEERQMLSLAAASPALSTSRFWLQNTAGDGQTTARLENLALLQANSPRLRLHPEHIPLILAQCEGDILRQQISESLREALGTQYLDFDFVRAELGNILGLIEWAADQNLWQEVVELGRAVDPYLTLRGLWDSWRGVLDKVLHASLAINDPAAEAWALHQLGTREFGAGQPRKAQRLLEQARDLRRSLGDYEAAGYSEHNLEMVRRSSGGLPPIDSPPGNPPLDGDGPPRGSWLRRSKIFLWIIVFILIVAPITGGYALRHRIPAIEASIAALGDIGGSLAMVSDPVDSPPEVAAVPPTMTFTPTTIPSETPTLTPTDTSTPLPTSTATSTSTDAPIPTATLTPTETPTFTPEASPTLPVPVIEVIVDQANCRYGPGKAYLYADGLYAGDVGTVQGRNYGSTWLYVQLEKDGRYCWVSTDAVEVRGDITTLQVTSPRLPHTVDTAMPTGVNATRKGDKVTVTWDQVHVNLQDARGYLLEVTLCQNGARFSVIVQTDATSYEFTDEERCGGKSSGKIYAVNTRGYTDSVPIAWP